ncbi:7-cyano-7-deazaguanine synthase [Massilia alkalitolerans]|uniref:7-cyano-7-deazaguanine synthase n=1 Tax=Massilia alkalitolerans TaxID=286638 RepID=UPI00047FE5A3|nr:7-cyano-7-deazaguanine synthase [Massilia alkalitolerans]
MKTALLLSGGMDSISIAWWKRPQIAITVDYGQKAAEAEKKASAAVCAQLGIEHHIVTVDCRSLGSGDMAGSKPDAAAPASDWWPYRNQLLVTLAAMKAIGLGATTLLIGSVSSDEGHRDGTTEFVRLMDDLLSYQEGTLRVEAPAIGMTTQELVRTAEVPAAILAWAHSCHKANLPCGNCRGCNKYNQSMYDLEYAGKLL